MAAAWLETVEKTHGKPTAAAVAEAVRRQTLRHRAVDAVGRMEAAAAGLKALRGNDGQLPEFEVFFDAWCAADDETVTALADLLACWKEGRLEDSQPQELAESITYWTAIADHMQGIQNVLGERKLRWQRLAGEFAALRSEGHATT